MGDLLFLCFPCFARSDGTLAADARGPMARELRVYFMRELAHALRPRCAYFARHAIHSLRIGVNAMR